MYLPKEMYTVSLFNLSIFIKIPENYKKLPFICIQEHPFIKRHEELEVDVAGYVSNILDKMQAVSSDDLIASSSS